MPVKQINILDLFKFACLLYNAYNYGQLINCNHNVVQKIARILHINGIDDSNQHINLVFNACSAILYMTVGTRDMTEHWRFLTCSFPTFKTSKSFKISDGYDKSLTKPHHIYISYVDIPVLIFKRQLFLISI